MISEPADDPESSHTVATEVHGKQPTVSQRSEKSTERQVSVHVRSAASSPQGVHKKKARVEPDAENLNRDLTSAITPNTKKRDAPPGQAQARGATRNHGMSVIDENSLEQTQESAAEAQRTPAGSRKKTRITVVQKEQQTPSKGTRIVTQGQQTMTEDHSNFNQLDRTEELNSVSSDEHQQQKIEIMQSLHRIEPAEQQESKTNSGMFSPGLVVSRNLEKFESKYSSMQETLGSQGHDKTHSSIMRANERIDAYYNIVPNPKPVFRKSVLEEVKESKEEVKIFQTNAAVLHPRHNIEHFTEGTQTDQAGFVSLACQLFLSELKAQILEHSVYKEDTQFKELIKQAEHIIKKIKNKAASYTGLVGGSGHGCGSPYGPSVLTFLPSQPSPFVHNENHERSWHFDVSSSPNRPNRKAKLFMNVLRVQENNSQQKDAAIESFQSTVNSQLIGAKNSGGSEDFIGIGSSSPLYEMAKKIEISQNNLCAENKIEE